MSINAETDASITHFLQLYTTRKQHAVKTIHTLARSEDMREQFRSHQGNSFDEGHTLGPSARLLQQSNNATH